MPVVSTRAVIVVVAIAIWQGMIGVLVKWMSWPPLAIVAGRCAIAALCLWSLIAVRRHRRGHLTPSVPLNSRQKRAIIGGGVLLGAHWASLFLGYRVSDVGPVVVALFTFPIMASVTEPYCFGSRPLPRQFIAALIGGCGVAQMILVSSGNDHSQTWGLGILLGLISAAFWAARGIQARSLLQGTDALTIMAVQVSVAGVLLAPALLYVAWPISLQDLGLIALFGVAFTALPHTLTVWALKHLSFTAISIIGSLQVLSAVLMASWLLEEQLTSSVWLGALLVTLAVLGESARSLFAQQAANSSESSSPSGQSNPKRK